MEFESTDDGFRIVEEYNASLSKKIMFMAVLAVALLLVICYACTIGARDIDILSIPGLIIDHIMGAQYEYGTAEWWDDFIIWNERMPRVLMACVAGASLAICGAAVQSLMNNPIADPYTMGISSGASFGAVLAIVLGFSFASSSGTYGISINAFIFGMIPVGIVILLSRFVRMTPVTLILVGVAISQFFGSLSTVVMMNAEEGTLQAAYLWQVGSLSGATWSELPMMTFFLVIGAIALSIVSWKFNVMTLGDDAAKTLGVNTEVFRIIALTLTALMTMSIVAYTGIIGFVGIIAPHIVRYIIGSDNKYVMPASLLSGAILLLVADTVARLFIYESVPVGAVMSFIGAPIFIYLVVKKNSLFKGAY